MTTEQDRYVELFEAEYERASDEFYRLSILFRDVCWYNFETCCRDWQEPWRKSDPRSRVCLESHRYENDEQGMYAVYYDGAVGEAPALPPEIVLKEVVAAQAYMEQARARISDPYDYAPGGCKYLELLETTLFPVAGRCRRTS